MKVVITGAAGFIGSHLTERCLALGWHVVAIDSMTTYYSPAAKVRNAQAFGDHDRCTYLEQDLLDLDLDALFTEADTVFHLAAQAGVRASWGPSFDTYTHLNVTVLQRLLEAARRASSIPRFLFVSSSSVYGDVESFPTSEQQILRPVSPYGATKALGEHLSYLYFRNYGVPVVVLRYFSVYGPRQRPDMAFYRAIEAALHRREFVLYGDGRQTRDFTFVEDAVNGTLQAAGHGVAGKAYNIGGGSRITMLDVLDLVRAELPQLVVHHEQTQQGDARNTEADISLARADFGYKPLWDVRRGLHEQIKWHQNR
jgi:UDP-glucose 4-epimerase